MTADEAIRDLTQSFQSVSLKPMNARPDVLYHYTSAQGLLGIITSGVLRAGNFSFFNDSSELTYGQDLVRDVVVEELGNVPNQLLQLMSLRLQHRLYAFSDEFDFYLCCFCEDADLLSQWRAYGSSGSRFCIGFSTEDLHSAKRYLLGRVEYNEGAQRETILDAIERATAVVRDHEGERVVEEVERLLVEKLSRELSFFKHPGFSEEREWRAVHQTQDPLKVDFDTRFGILKPFTELFIGRSSEGVRQLPIVEVMVGAARVGGEFPIVLQNKHP